MEGAAKCRPFPFLLTIYCMRFILKEFEMPGITGGTLTPPRTMEEEGCDCGCNSCSSEPEYEDEMDNDEVIEITPEVLSGLIKLAANTLVFEKKNKKKKRDRCTKLAASKFKPFPSYNAASAIARCRRGEIWKKRKK